MNFPEELTQRKQWIVWKFEQYEGDKKPRKVPYYVSGGKRFGDQGSEADLNKLATFEDALRCFNRGGYSGLGLGLFAGSGLACLDIDSNADMQQAREIMEDLNSYTEVSPSGLGFHVWVKCESETFKNNKLGLEFFASSQFITMTGNRVNDFDFNVKEISQFKVKSLKAIIKGSDEKHEPKPKPIVTETEAQKIESALIYISSECGYDEWYRVGAAIYSALGESGFSIWDYWSSKSSKYSSNGMREKYRTFASIHDISIATVYKMACDNGWKPPRDPNWKPDPPVKAAPIVEKPQEMEEPKKEPRTEFFKFLGYDRDTFYVFQYEKNQICELKKSDLSETGFLTLAPEQYWSSYFPHKNGFDKKTMTDWFIRKCYDAGIFKNDVIRGRGAWWDDKRAVFHFGSNLWVDGKYADVSDLKSDYIYEVSRKISLETNDVLTQEDGRKLLNTAKMFRWQKPASAPLLCGWLMLARICGALKWRPHVWITGESGSGKSTIMDRFIYHLTGKNVIFAQGNSTEAGIRQKLKNDALPVLFDESEQTNEREQNRVQNIISLIRQSSSESGAQTLKGTATGEATTFHIRSMFMLSSIQVQILMQADMERITVFPLMPKRQDNAADQWKKLESNLLDIGLDDTISDRLFMRSLKMLPTILKNIEVFRIAAAKYFGTVREGDQYGTLLAGCWSMCEDRQATLNDAQDMINKLDWTEYTNNSEDTESKKTLSSILEAKIRIPHGEASLFEIIDIARNGIELNKGVDLSQVEANAVLARNGMKLDDTGLLISNNTTSINSFLKGSQYQSDWKGQILRIEGVAKHSKSVRFNGVVSRCIHVDFSVIGF